MGVASAIHRFGQAHAALRNDFPVANLQREPNRSSAGLLVDNPVDWRWKELGYAS
jgi:hypothetical protein